MAPRTDRTTRIPSGVASPVTTKQASKGSVFVNLKMPAILTLSCVAAGALERERGALLEDARGLAPPHGRQRTVYIDIDIYIYVYIYMHVYVNAYVYIHVHMYIRMYVCAYIYRERERERRKERER